VPYFGIAVGCLFAPGELFRLSFMPTTIAGAAPNPMTLLPYTLAGSLFGVILSVVAHAMLTHATVTDLSGGRPTFGDCLKRAATHPAAGRGRTARLFRHRFRHGPVDRPRHHPRIDVVGDRPLARRGTPRRHREPGPSRALTKGSRWRLFGLFLVAGIVLFVPPAIIAGFATRLQGGGMPSPLSPATLLGAAVGSFAAMRQSLQPPTSNCARSRKARRTKALPRFLIDLSESDS